MPFNHLTIFLALYTLFVGLPATLVLAAIAYTRPGKIAAGITIAVLTSAFLVVIPALTLVPEGDEQTGAGFVVAALIGVPLSIGATAIAAQSAGRRP